MANQAFHRSSQVDGGKKTFFTKILNKTENLKGENKFLNLTYFIVSLTVICA